MPGSNATIGEGKILRITPEKTRRGSFCCVFIAFMLASLVLSGCQGLALQVDQVALAQDLLAVRAQNCDYGGHIRSVEALDRYTVRFGLCTSDPAFVEKLASPIFAIQDLEYLHEQQGDSGLLSAAPNVSGPYQVAEFVPEDHIVLQRNPQYWGVPARLPIITISWASSPISRLVALNQGRVQGIDRPEIVKYDVYFESDRSLFEVNREGLNTAYLGMNNQVPPFDDVRVRRALSLLLDRQEIVNQYYPLGSFRADQFIPPSLEIGYITPFSWLETDPQSGLDLLAQAGFDFNQTLVLAYNTTESDFLPRPADIAQEVRDQLGGYGIKVALKWMSAADLRAALDTGSEGFFLTGWSADFPDASNFYDTVFLQGAARFGQLDKHFLELIRDANTNSDKAVRQARYREVNEWLRDQVPAIPIVHGNTKLLFSSEVEAVLVGPLNENFAYMSAPGGVLNFMQTSPPASLWPADERDADTFRVTSLLYSRLVDYDYGSARLRPALAESWTANSDQTEWTFDLRVGVKFSNGALLDANDVVASFAAIWDASSPNHTGRSGDFELFKKFFGEFLNP